MTDTNQLPEPELGYIQTDKSNQPAFSARQMREAMGRVTQAEVTDAEIVAVMRDGNNCNYNDEAEHIQFARAILALRPERVPMTDDELCEALGIDGSDDWTYQVRDAVEAHHRIKPKGTP
jgi:hypothetical protein